MSEEHYKETLSEWQPESIPGDDGVNGDGETGTETV